MQNQKEKNIKYDRIIFGLGSNIGDRELYLSMAEEFLIAELNLLNVKKSKIFINKALLKKDAPKEWDIDFMNIAISADIDSKMFNSEKILKIIKNIEKKLGRKTVSENALLWAPREIDIDILAISNLIIIDGERLTIPHKSLLERLFFLKTFAEIEPDWRYPVAGDFYNKKIIDIFLEN